MVDLFKKYQTFIKYIFFAITSFLLDICLFKIIYIVRNNIIIASYLARLVSSVYNYLVNKKIVFGYNKKRDNSFIKYFVLAVLNITLSGVLVTFVYDKMSFDVTLIKISIDTLIFVINYFIQKILIFKNET